MAARNPPTHIIIQERHHRLLQIQNPHGPEGNKSELLSIFKALFLSSLMESIVGGWWSLGMCIEGRSWSKEVLPREFSIKIPTTSVDAWYSHTISKFALLFIYSCGITSCPITQTASDKWPIALNSLLHIQSVILSHCCFSTGETRTFRCRFIFVLYSSISVAQSPTTSA